MSSESQQEETHTNLCRAGTNQNSSCSPWNLIQSVLDPEYVDPEEEEKLEGNNSVTGNPSNNNVNSATNRTASTNIIQARLITMERNQILDDWRQEGAPKSLEMMNHATVDSREADTEHTTPRAVMELGDMLVVRPNSQLTPTRDRHNKRRGGGLRAIWRLRTQRKREHVY